MAWMWGALLAATIASWLHQLTAVTAGQDILAGHGIRRGKAMIGTLRQRLIAVPGRLVCHGQQLLLRLPPGCHLLAQGPRPPPGTPRHVLTWPYGPRPGTWNREPGATPGHHACPHTGKRTCEDH
jgi:hypothetical protein